VSAAPVGPPPYPIDHCRSCGAEIIWAVAERSLRSIPVDVAPLKGGNIRLIPREDRPPMARSLTVEQRSRTSQGDLRQAHFASCPNADKHRQGKHRAGAR
jgi:hypothetical protein